MTGNEPFLPRQLDDGGFDNNSCVGCSQANPEGLKLQFVQTAVDTVESTFQLRQSLCGWPGVAHGGIVSLLLDEVTAWCFAGCLNERHFATKELNVKFLAPTPLQQPLRAVARLLSEEGRAANLEGKIINSEGVVTATATARIVRLSQQQYDRFKDLSGA